MVMAQDSLVISALGKQQENQKFKVNYNYSNFKARYTSLDMPDWGFLLCRARPLGNSLKAGTVRDLCTNLGA